MARGEGGGVFTEQSQPSRPATLDQTLLESHDKFVKAFLPRVRAPIALHCIALRLVWPGPAWPQKSGATTLPVKFLSACVCVCLSVCLTLCLSVSALPSLSDHGTLALLCFALLACLPPSLSPSFSLSSFPKLLLHLHRQEAEWTGAQPSGATLRCACISTNQHHTGHSMCVRATWTRIA